MIIDTEENKISLLESPNPHILVLGNSGYGKTYFLCRKIEELVENQRKIFLIDYSGSYTQSELMKNQFCHLETIQILNPLKEAFDWNFRGKNFGSNLTDALVKGLKIRSYSQKKLLREGIFLTLSFEKSFTFSLLMEQLESLLKVESNSETEKNICHLLTRIEPYSELSNIRFLCKKEDIEDEEKAKVCIIQVSDYPEIQRKFLVEFLAEIFWKEARYGMRRSDVILLDEFQSMSVKPGSALSAMLREGRKFGLSVYLSSQFLGNYDKEEVDTLMQAANKILFRPTENDLKIVAHLIDPNNKKIWENILKKLQRGEAVLKGRYFVNQNKKEIEASLLCRIK